MNKPDLPHRSTIGPWVELTPDRNTKYTVHRDPDLPYGTVTCRGDDILLAGTGYPSGLTRTKEKAPSLIFTPDGYQITIPKNSSPVYDSSFRLLNVGKHDITIKPIVIFGEPGRASSKVIVLSSRDESNVKVRKVELVTNKPRPIKIDQDTPLYITSDPQRAKNIDDGKCAWLPDTALDAHIPMNLYVDNTGQLKLSRYSDRTAKITCRVSTPNDVEIPYNPETPLNPGSILKIQKGRHSVAEFLVLKNGQGEWYVVAQPGGKCNYQDIQNLNSKYLNEDNTHTITFKPAPDGIFCGKERLISQQFMF